MALESEADFFQVHPRAHESGFDMRRHDGIKRGLHSNSLEVHCLSEGRRPIDATTWAGFRLTARRFRIYGDDRHVERQYGA
jgi:hypothetical protein